MPPMMLTLVMSASPSPACAPPTCAPLVVLSAAPKPLHSCVCRRAHGYFRVPMASVRIPCASVLIVRVGGNLSGDTLFELSSLPPKTLQRISEESGLWY